MHKKKISGKKSEGGNQGFAGQSELDALDVIERSWPTSPSHEVSAAFVRLKSALKRLKGVGEISAAGGAERGLAGEAVEWPFKGGPTYFDPLDLIRRVIVTHDLLFLSRQVTYHIAQDADVPGVFAEKDQMQFVFSQLIEHLVKRSTQGARISVSLREFVLRGGQGIEIGFSTTDRHLSDTDRQSFVTELFGGKMDPVSNISLSNCRQIVARQQGRLWVDFPRPNRPLYHLVLPSSEQTVLTERASQQTFKYDITISNFSDVKRRFGFRKSISLVGQIEQYVKTLVRYPLDMVISLGDRGLVTAIYETERGAAQSVASRISQRLGSEKFRIGKRPVEVAFSYHLSPLTPTKS